MRVVGAARTQHRAGREVEAADPQVAREVGQRERADGHRVVTQPGNARRRADAALVAEAHHAAARAHRPLGRETALRAVERGVHVVGRDRPRADVGQPPVVALRHERVERRRGLLAGAAQHPVDQGVGGGERGQRRGQHDRRLERAELDQLGGADELAVTVAHREIGWEGTTFARQLVEDDGRDPGDDVVRAVGSRPKTYVGVAHAHTGHVGDRVVRTGRAAVPQQGVRSGRAARVTGRP
ncbi:hypothetical protein GCM10025872_24230 [Barrientosiimonas endolithica]|uniref:Uncharacterized protein n=1 Tax=Barrientosiimonas endolithica TaxID=1535208 RepID=A0ABN6YP22_9MICO|nr:hypothetical protein GCM10025872_24230 [Barrientosiimonas endolithica]